MTRSILISALALSGLLAAAELDLSVEIPRLAVAEYHRPYVAIWVERPDQSFAANLAVWYQLQDTPKGEKGATWLKDLRSWWRKSGRDLNLPVDGVSGATRPPGVHKVSFKGSHRGLASLAPGAYHLVVEMARETGGRELVRVPFQWPAPAGQPAPTAKAQGSHEIGQVLVTVKP